MSAVQGSHRPTTRDPLTFRPLSSSQSHHTGVTRARLGKGHVREACGQALPGQATLLQRCHPPAQHQFASQHPRLVALGNRNEIQCDLPACVWGLAPNPSAVLLGHLTAATSLPNGVKETWLPWAGAGHVSGGQLVPAVGIPEPEEWKSEAAEPQVSSPWCLVLHQPHLQPSLSNYARRSQPNLPASEWRNDCKPESLGI